MKTTALTRKIAATALAACVIAPAASPAAAEAFFKTPGGAVYCMAEGSMYCWTPNDGFTVQMTAYGYPTKNYSRGNKGHYPRGYPTLRFGQARRFGAIRCSSRHDGLTCVNRAGHGWWLGRWVGYRLF